MSQISAVHALRIPEHTRQKLDAFRRRVWTIKIAEGALAALFGLLLSYLLVFLLDRLMDTPAWARALILLAGAAGLGVWFPWKCHRWVWRTRRFDQLARLLRHRMPSLSDRLLGIIELAENEVEQERSADLCRAALRQVDRDIRDQDFDTAVPHPRHRAWAWAAAVPLVLGLLTLLLAPAAGVNALARWMLPWKNWERYTFAQLDSLPSTLVVPYAEPFTLAATLAAESVWRPDQATARIERQPGVTAARRRDRYHFELRPQKEDVLLSVSVGDARRRIAVQPKTRPELNTVSARVQLPDYLQYSQVQEHDVRGGGISLVHGSRVEFVATISSPLAQAALDGQPQAIDGSTIVTAPKLVRDSGPVELTWRDEFGLSAKEPFQLSIQAVDDQAPSITCHELGQHQIVIHDQVLTFEVSADDDFGLKHVGIEWHGIEDPLQNPTPDQGETLLLAGGPQQRELVSKVTFSAAREGIHPQTLQLRLFTVDYFPNRQRVYSPMYTLHVLTAADHAIWLTDQMRRWSRQAQAVYERENQLYEVNKQLRQLSPDELDSSRNRQRIESQAAAEQSNARQLAAVSSMGKQLLQEATRNDQFDAMTMENLARTLNMLDELAQNRMPSVADLLRQAASAPSASTDAPPGSPNDGSPPTPSPQVGNNRDPQATGASGGQQDASKDEEQPPVPSIVDVESSFNETPKPDDEQQAAESQSSSGPPKFGLPTTTVVGGGAPPSESQSPPAQEKLDEAIAEQENLLEEFAAVAEELQRILDSLEGSTFVKRLKAASRRQLEVANELNAELASHFGRRVTDIPEPSREWSAGVAERETAESENVYIIQQDLEAYYNRVQQGKYLTVLQEMHEMAVPGKLRDLAGLVNENLHGRSIAHAEFWADTFDRWGEQLIGPGESSSSESSPDAKGKGSLPPKLVLEVMKLLEREVGLREETRGAEQGREVWDAPKYELRAASLAETQAELADQTADVTDQLRELEANEGLEFPQEIKLLTRVEGVMREAHDVLALPETGPEAIAAETEVIELLLQAKRSQPPKGGTSSGSSPGGGGTGDTDEAALALLGRGDEEQAAPVERTPTQATGTSGFSYPAEFRAGLDTYFSELEK